MVQRGADIVITSGENKYVITAEWLIGQTQTTPLQNPRVDSQQYQIKEIRRQYDRTSVQYDGSLKNEYPYYLMSSWRLLFFAAIFDNQLLTKMLVIKETTTSSINASNTD